MNEIPTEVDVPQPQERIDEAKQAEITRRIENLRNALRLSGNRLRKSNDSEDQDSILTVEEDEEKITVTFTQTKFLDEHLIHTTADSLLQIADKGSSKKIVLDLQHVTYMSSSMFGKFILLSKLLSFQNRGPLTVLNVAPNILKVMDGEMKLGKVMNIESSQKV